jgi:hypothetical protein
MYFTGHLVIQLVTHLVTYVLRLEKSSLPSGMDFGVKFM